MHVLYVHQNFPAQFGHIARRLVKSGWKCTFVSETPAGNVEGIEKIQYRITGGATLQTHFCSRTFENAVWHTDAVYKALKARDDIRPDLIVGHSGFGSTLFLPELYPGVPIVSFFEFYYRVHEPDSDMDFRRDLGWRIEEQKYLRSRCRNAMILLDLQACTRGYVPTQFQRSRFPAHYQSQLKVIFDGVDREVYHGHNEELRPLDAQGPRTLAGVEIPAGTRLVTYVSRGFESMRGFDIFMRSAELIAQRYPDVIFIVVGTERMVYGGDENYIVPCKTFKEWVLSRHNFDMSRFRFVGRLAPQELGRLLAATDLHIYLTVPFVLSWSMMDAMSGGAVVLGSATSPVQEMIVDGQNGLLVDFFDVEQIASKAVAVLKDPGAYRPLGRAAEQMIVDKYSLDAVLPAMTALYDEALSDPEARKRQTWRPPPLPGDQSESLATSDAAAVHTAQFATDISSGALPSSDMPATPADDIDTSVRRPKSSPFRG